jgi:hypothetical protein
MQNGTETHFKQVKAGCVFLVFNIIPKQSKQMMQLGYYVSLKILPRLSFICQYIR